MFKSIEETKVSKGNFLLLFTNWGRFKKYLCCILIGAPLWYVVGVLISLQPEFGVALHATGKLNAGDGIQYAYIAIAFGGIGATVFWQQLTKSRKLVMYILLILSAISVVVYLSSTGLQASNICGSAFLWGLVLAIGRYLLLLLPNNSVPISAQLWQQPSQIL